MQIFMTGGNGDIGSTIRGRMEDDGIEVIAPSSSELNLEDIGDISGYPEVDGFIHCAGINDLAHHDRINIHLFDRLFAINTTSFVLLCSQLKFKENSNIVAIGSLYSTHTREDRIQYAMSKHALLAAVKTIALEKASKKVAVNMISPGFVNTKMTRKNNTSERIEHLNRITPLGLTDAIQIAGMCRYLVKENRAITGQNILIDGGYSLVGA